MWLRYDQIGISSLNGPWALWALSLASWVVVPLFTIIVTGLVVARILLVRRRHTKILGTSDTSRNYMNIVAMLVESYALDSLWDIAFIISYGLHSRFSFLFAGVSHTIKVIAYFLVVYRVASGRGWTRDTGLKLTTLQWNRGESTAAGFTSEIHSRPPAKTTTVMA